MFLLLFHRPLNTRVFRPLMIGWVHCIEFMFSVVLFDVSLSTLHNILSSTPALSLSVFSILLSPSSFTEVLSHRSFSVVSSVSSSVSVCIASVLVLVQLLADSGVDVLLPESVLWDVGRQKHIRNTSAPHQKSIKYFISCSCKKSVKKLSAGYGF